MASNPTPPEQPARLFRSRDDRIIGGVAGGIGHHLNIDPTLVRIGFVAGILIWGAGILVYIAALVLMPEEGTEPGTRRLTLPSLEGRNRTLAAIGVVVLVLVGVPVALVVGGVLLPFAFLALLAIGVAWAVTGRRPSGETGDLVRATLLGLGVMALLFVLSVTSFWGAAAGGDEVIAGLVIAAGLALVVSAFAKPARWLILPALAVAIPAGLVAAAGIDLDGGVGDKRYRPLTASAIRSHYEVGAGQLTVDLRRVDLPDGVRHLDIDVGMGESKILVPEDVCDSTTAKLGAGGINVFDHEGGGVDYDWEDLNRAAPGAAQLVVDADVGFGALNVRHDDDYGWQGRHDDPQTEACVA